MSIIRPELPSDHYTMIPNEWLRDNRLTYSARGLLADLMSNKPGWTVTLESLAKNGPHGLSAIRRMVGELETVGYLKRARTHDDAGRFGESDYVICAPIDHDGETPSVDKSHIGSDKHKHSITPSGDQYAETPPLDNTISGVSVRHKKTIQLEDYLEEDQTEEDIAHPEDERPCKPHTMFDTWWEHYPRKVGKTVAQKTWQALIKRVGTVDQQRDFAQTIIDATIRMAADPNLPEREFRPYPTTWLNRGGWEDEPYPPRHDQEGYGHRNSQPPYDRMAALDAMKEPE